MALFRAEFGKINGNNTNLAILRTGQLPSMAERLKEWGVNNVMVSGTTGESVSLTADERKMLAEEWINNLVSD